MSLLSLIPPCNLDPHKWIRDDGPYVKHPPPQNLFAYRVAKDAFPLVPREMSCIAIAKLKIGDILLYKADSYGPCLVRVAATMNKNFRTVETVLLYDLNCTQIRGSTLDISSDSPCDYVHAKRCSSEIENPLPLYEYIVYVHKVDMVVVEEDGFEDLDTETWTNYVQRRHAKESKEKKNNTTTVVVTGCEPCHTQIVRDNIKTGAYVFVEYDIPWFRLRNYGAHKQDRAYIVSRVDAMVDRQYKEEDMKHQHLALIDMGICILAHHTNTIRYFFSDALVHRLVNYTYLACHSLTNLDVYEDARTVCGGGKLPTSQVYLINPCFMTHDPADALILYCETQRLAFEARVSKIMAKLPTPLANRTLQNCISSALAKMDTIHDGTFHKDTVVYNMTLLIKEHNLIAYEGSESNMRNMLRRHFLKTLKNSSDLRL